MHKTFAILVCLLSLSIASDAKSNDKIVLVPDVQGRQASLRPTDKHQENTILVREAGNDFAISVGMIAPGTDTVRLLLNVTNASSKLHVFSPNEIVVILPNGHSYRPFSRVDVLALAHQIKSDPKGKKGSAIGTAPKEETASVPTCSMDREISGCSTTSETSMQAWYARRTALVAAIRNSLHHQKFKKYILDLEQNYLPPQQLAPGDALIGYVDVYVENAKMGPLTVRVPAGNTTWSAPAPGQLAVPKTTYDFRFHPQVVVDAGSGDDQLE